MSSAPRQALYVDAKNSCNESYHGCGGGTAKSVEGGAESLGQSNRTA